MQTCLVHPECKVFVHCDLDSICSHYKQGTINLNPEAGHSCFENLTEASPKCPKVPKWSPEAHSTRDQFAAFNAVYIFDSLIATTMLNAALTATLDAAAVTKISVNTAAMRIAKAK